MRIKLSIIIPILNEQDYIKPLIKKLQTIKPISKEIILVDGGSTDKTIDIIKEETSGMSNIKLLHNDKKYAPFAFNIGFCHSIGDYIAFIGSHADYSENYFEEGIAILNKKKECGGVGGILLQKGKGSVGESIALCMSNKFGVGNTEFRTVHKDGYVQSVAFAIYNRGVIEKVGLMDENLIRNQDDEFHYRMGEFGYRIFMSTNMRAEYFVRNSLIKLFKQYFEYGLYKPFVIKKINSGFRLRHAIPALFVINIIILLVYHETLLAIPILIYLLLDIYFSFTLKTDNLKHNLIALLTFPILHFSYGSGTLVGILKLIQHGRNRKN